jgi:rRNA maturation endonuclease Nob1
MKALEDAVLDGKTSFADAMNEFSRTIIASVLRYHEGNVTETAKSLGINRQSLSMMLQRRMRPGKYWSPTRKPREKAEAVEDAVCEECGSPICVCPVVARVLENHTTLA